MTLRRQPADFRVEEIAQPDWLAGLSAEPTSAHTHSVWTLEKRSLTTPDALSLLARSLSVRAASIAYAGLKDKHAETSQHVSVHAPPDGANPALAAAAVATRSGRGWSATRIGWVAAPVSASIIAANRFAIIVRGLNRDEAGQIERRAALLRDRASEPAEGAPAGGRALLVVNYFGDQRFGSARHGKGFAAAAAVRGELEQAIRLLVATPARKDSGRTRDFTRIASEGWGRWRELAEELPRCPERRPFEVLASGGTMREAFAALPDFTKTMAIEAFQSRIWNETARRIAEAIAGEGKSMRCKGPFGTMCFPDPAALDAWRKAQVPMAAPGMPTASDAEAMERMGGEAHAAEVRSAIKESLRAEGVDADDLRIPGLDRPFFGGAWRPFAVRAERFLISKAERDELAKGDRLRRTVTFDLPRGAYATVVLRALGQ
jgi:tRNA pseudouridine13 synthase